MITVFAKFLFNIYKQTRYLTHYFRFGHFFPSITVFQSLLMFLSSQMAKKVNFWWYLNKYRQLEITSWEKKIYLKKKIGTVSFRKNFLGWAGFEPGPKRFRRQLSMDCAIQADKRLDLDTCLSRASSNPVRSCIEFILSWICLSPMEDTTRHSHLSGILNLIVLWTYLKRIAFTWIVYVLNLLENIILWNIWIFYTKHPRCIVSNNNLHRNLLMIVGSAFWHIVSHRINNSLITFNTCS